MSIKYDTHIIWNPWHGCHKVSDGCRYCFVYRQDEMYGSAISSSEVRKTGNFNLPTKRKRDRSYKVPSGEMIMTCFSSDFLIKEADEWRTEAWAMMRERSDCKFMFFTKRIERLAECLPEDWGTGYENVIIGCTVENQHMVDYRLPIFKSLPVKHRAIIAAPLLERIELSQYLDTSFEHVSVGGESGLEARECNYDWILEIRSLCIERGIGFYFHQTGARLRKDGKLYRIGRYDQTPQARKANINYTAR